MSNELIEKFEDMKQIGKIYNSIGVFTFWLESVIDGPDANDSPDIKELVEYVRKQYPMKCPETGVFTAWKKAWIFNEKDDTNDYAIVELEVPADAKRLNSGFSNKCRCDKALVKRITSLTDGTDYQEAVSDYGGSTVYRVGEMVFPDEFSENPFDDCTHGIHFYMSREAATNHYMFYGGIRK